MPTRLLRKIDKVEETPNGHLIVSGIVTGPDVDRDKQRCDPAWVSKAVPAWLEESAAVREMHGKVAAGTGLGVYQEGEEWGIKALIVDAGTKEKVKTGVLSMFSIGIADATVTPDPTGKAVNGVIGGDGKIPEISLVDLGSYKGARVSDVLIAKSAEGHPLALLETVELRDGVEVPEVTKDMDADISVLRAITCLRDDLSWVRSAQGMDDDPMDPNDLKVCDLLDQADELIDTLLCAQAADIAGEGMDDGADKSAVTGIVKAAVWTDAQRARFGEEKAARSAAATNDLPDAAFAYIEPGGTKDSGGKTIPRSKRHFPIDDAAHVRNALARASSSPFGDKAMPKIKAAAKKFGIEVSEKAEEATMEKVWTVLGIDEGVITKAAADDATDEDKAAVTTAVLAALGIEKYADLTDKIDKLTAALPEGQSLADVFARLDEVEKMAAPPGFAGRTGRPDERLQKAEKVAELRGEIQSLKISASAAQPEDQIAYGTRIADRERELAELVAADA
jgi:hypothetical protein